jgi:hypothetical protein
MTRKHVSAANVNPVRIKTFNGRISLELAGTLALSDVFSDVAFNPGLVFNLLHIQLAPATIHKIVDCVWIRVKEPMEVAMRAKTGSTTARSGRCFNRGSI